jgi:nuclear transport factor 2 (NTF2) superfamily protein
MRKRLIGGVKPANAAVGEEWLKLDDLAEVEISSEDAAHPIELALVPGDNAGWRAAAPGRQTIRLLFSSPQRLRRIRLVFVETSAQRTQEYLLRWSADKGQSFREIVRQQWNFNPHGATSETEEHQVELAGVDVLELIIAPDIGRDDAFASLAELRLA